MAKNFQCILSGESDGYEKTLSRLVSGYNCISAIEDAFDESKMAKRYLENAAEEVHSSGNQSLVSIYVIAIQNMASDIEKLEDEVNDIEYEKLYSECRSLEKENRKLRVQLAEIAKVLSETGEPS